MTAKENSDGKKKPIHRSVDVDTKDYVALVIAMAETTMLPLILLLFVLVIVGAVIMAVLLH